MSRLHYFYPENDGALAAGTAGYVSRKNPMALRRSGVALALWTGADGDAFISQGVPRNWLEEIHGIFGMDVDEYSGCPYGFEPFPWGWSLPVVQTYADAGFDAAVLPDAAAIERIRQLSHRRTAAVLAAALRAAYGSIFLPAAVEADSVAAASEAIAAFGRAMVKLPWSSSGRGVMDTADVPAPELARRIAGTIRRQGSVMVEPFLAGASDFALLYSADGAGSVDYVGLSVFGHDSHYAYSGGIVAGDDILVRVLREKGIKLPPQLPGQLAAALGKIIGNGYRGLLGVDLVSDGCRFAVAEINLRSTMGHVAHAIAEKWLSPGLTATFTIRPRDLSHTSFSPFANCRSLILDNCRVAERRLSAGTLALNAPDTPFAFLLQVN